MFKLAAIFDKAVDQTYTIQKKKHCRILHPLVPCLRGPCVDHSFYYVKREESDQ